MKKFATYPCLVTAIVHDERIVRRQSSEVRRAELAVGEELGTRVGKERLLVDEKTLWQIEKTECFARECRCDSNVGVFNKQKALPAPRSCKIP